MGKLSLSLLFFISMNITIYAQAALFDSSGVFIGKPDVLPSHRSGIDGWLKFISRNLNIEDSVAVAGPIIATVSFIIDKQGSVTNFTPVNDLEFGILAKFINLIRSGPGYTPAMVNGKPVKYRYTETVNLDPSEF